MRCWLKWLAAMVRRANQGNSLRIRREREARRRGQGLRLAGLASAPQPHHPIHDFDELRLAVGRGEAGKVEPRLAADPCPTERIVRRTLYLAAKFMSDFLPIERRMLAQPLHAQPRSCPVCLDVQQGEALLELNQALRPPFL